MRPLRCGGLGRRGIGVRRVGQRVGRAQGLADGQRQAQRRRVRPAGLMFAAFDLTLSTHGRAARPAASVVARDREDAHIRLPAHAVAALQRRLGAGGALNEYIKHTSSAVFAVPAGVRPGGYVAQGLFA